MNNKKMFRFRMMATYFMVVSWTLSGPVLKTYFNLLPTLFFSVIGIWVMIIGLSQKWLRKNLTIEKLLLLVIILDTVFITGTMIFNIEKNIKYLLIFHMVMDGPYHALLTASVGKLESYYIGKFKPVYQETIRATITNRKIYSTLIGLSLGGILSTVLNVYNILWVMIVVMSIGVILEIKALRS